VPGLYGERALTLLQNISLIALNTSTPFAGSGGTPPYTYSVLGGGAGGTIDPSTGLYTAPSVSGSDTIHVVDSLSATAQATISVGNALQLFCDVLQTEMGLANGQVYLWDQKINIPTDSQLYIAVGVTTCKPFSNSYYTMSNGNSLQAVNMQAMLSVDILSRGPDARDRKEEIIMALSGTYAQQQQEANNFYIGKISTGFTNLSEIDGAAIPYRFNIAVALMYTTSKVKTSEYYDSFPTFTTITDP